jgi:AbrB family looped-hinge helix DNA binding protein
MKSKEKKVISLDGPVEKIGNNLMLRIPLEIGGLELLEYTRKIGKVEGDDLVIIIPEYLAEKLNISEGSMVNVNTENGKFTIQPKEDEKIED